MTENDCKKAAEWIITNHGRDVEFTTVVELVCDQYAESVGEDCEKIADLISLAKVEVSWDD